MSFAEYARVYVCANALLALSYLAFRLSRRAVGGARGLVSHRQLIRIGQLLIALSCIAPLGLRQLPRAYMPPIRWPNFLPAPEDAGERRPSAKASRPRLSARAPAIRGDASLAPALSQVLRNWLARDAAAGAFAILFGAWAAGASVFLARFYRGYRRLRSLLRAATPIRVLGRVRVAVSEAVSVPFSARIGLESWVILPARMLENARDFRLALRHELQHHRQGDTSWAVAIELLISFFFLNPAAFLWKREISELQEFSCDEALIGHRGISPHDYGSCLVRVAEAALGARQMPVGITGMATFSRNPSYKKSFLRRRVEMFASQTTEKRGVRPWAAWALGTLVTAITMALAMGAEQSFRGPPPPPANPGMLVVDEAVQKIAEEALRDAIRDQKARAGFAIVADPRSGKILAVANLDTQEARAGHWALSERFEAASLEKSIVAAQAIEDRRTTPDEEFSGEHGSYRVGDRVYHDWKEGGWEKLTTTDIIAYSSDIGGIKLAEKIGPAGLLKMLADFGFGPEGTAQQVPEARTGVLPPTDEPEHPRLVGEVSSGWGFWVTPVEVLQAYGAIANGGSLLLPRAANSLDSQRQVIRRVLSSRTSEEMREILRQSVLRGTGKSGITPDHYSLAGKTATSWSEDWTRIDYMGATNNHLPDLASFIGFAPVKDPRVEVYVVIRDPRTHKGGAHGGLHAAPAFKVIAEKVLKLMNVAPDLPGGSG